MDAHWSQLSAKSILLNKTTESANHMSHSIFTPDCQSKPYWWERTPRPQLPAASLPAHADVVIIGSGYTGLCAALQTARVDSTTVVFDAEDAGWGCSSRNGGQISTGIKPSLQTLSRQYGAEHATRIIRTGNEALAWIGEFIQAENIDCDFKRCGRFYAAHSPRQFAKLVKTYGQSADIEIVPKAEQQRELGSVVYHGGIVQRRFAALDPARYHQALLERVLQAGAHVIPHCPVNRIETSGQGFRLHTTKGQTQARDVIVASNGYTSTLTPWLRRRVIPIGSYMIATEPLRPGLTDELIPNDRNIVDTRRVIFYYRASPDRQRILFGGRVSLQETNPCLSAPALHAEMTRIFPQLQGVRISHSWMGFIAYTFDAMPHLGQHRGIHYALGYCGSGIALASFLGVRIGQQVLGLAEGQTALDGLSFQTRPLYREKPWFLAPSLRYYRLLDRFGV